jgi:hypothetical protein
MSSAFGERSASIGPGPDGSGALITTLELVPDRLTARVYQHKVGPPEDPIPCWTYVTHGLAPHSQSEVAFTLRRRPHELPANYPYDPLRFFSDLYARVEQGHHLEAGDYSKFAYPEGFLGETGFIGMAYAPPEDFPGLDLPPHRLMAILLKGPEVEVVEQLGSYRVLTLLGRANRYYPCPPWSDRDRLVVLSKPDLTQSVLSQLPALCVRGAYVRLDDIGPDSTAAAPVEGWMKPISLGNLLRLTILRESLPALRDLLSRFPDQEGFALMTDPDPRADTRLVWKPGQNRVEAIFAHTSKGKSLTGGFVACGPLTDKEGGQILEDGFLVACGTEPWLRLRGALLTGQPFSLPGKGDLLSLELEWREQTYLNPVGETAYQPTGGWVRADPGGPARPPAVTEPVHCQGFVLLTSDPDIKQRLRSIEDLARFSSALEQAVRDHFLALPPGRGEDMTLQCELQPADLPLFQVAMRPAEVDDERIQELYERLVEIPAPPVDGGPVTFQAVFLLWGGSGQPTIFTKGRSLA